MTLNKWISKHLGKYVQYNKYTDSKYQCVDLAKSYCVEVLGFYERFPKLKEYWNFGDARNWYEGYHSHEELIKSCDRIPNTPTFVPIEGDICVFTENNKYGHICVAYNNNSTTSKIYTVDQNYPKGSKVKYCTHRYTTEGFLGVLRPFRIIKDDVNIRYKPSMSARIIGEYKKNTIVKIYELDSTKKWARTKDGWISYNYTKFDVD